MAYHIELTKQFHFDAAHHLGGLPEGHPYLRMHGHSFRVAVTIAGTPDPAMGWVADFADIDRILRDLRLRLDHQTLNTIEGLEQPTLERIGTWIFDALRTQLPMVTKISLHRDSIGETCTITLD